MSGLRNYWLGQVEWWRSRSLEWWAKHVTALYVAGAFMVMGVKFDELILLKLNEIGDLSAGVFGPVAFLWLMLGYIQQGRELSASSESIKETLDQHRELVAANKVQADTAQEAVRLASERRFRDIQPRFLHEIFAEPNRYAFKIVNCGYVVTNVEFVFVHEIYLNKSFSFFVGGQSFEFEIRTPHSGGKVNDVLRIKFKDADGTPGETIFDIHLDEHGLTNREFRLEVEPRTQ